LDISAIPIQGLGLSSRLQGTYRTERKRTPGNVNARNFGNGETGEESDRVGDVNRILENATYLVGGSQSSSGKTKESFSIEKKRIA
jgi:hypothetical protein